jgi:hypothetical protein
MLVGLFSHNCRGLAIDYTNQETDCGRPATG